MAPTVSGTVTPPSGRAATDGNAGGGDASCGDDRRPGATPHDRSPAPAPTAAGPARRSSGRQGLSMRRRAAGARRPAPARRQPPAGRPRASAAAPGAPYRCDVWHPGVPNVRRRRPRPARSRSDRRPNPPPSSRGSSDGAGRRRSLRGRPPARPPTAADLGGPRPGHARRAGASAPRPRGGDSSTPSDLLRDRPQSVQGRAGTSRRPSPPSSTLEQSPGTIVPLVAERRFVSASPPASAQRMGRAPPRLSSRLGPHARGGPQTPRRCRLARERPEGDRPVDAGAPRTVRPADSGARSATAGTDTAFVDAGAVAVVAGLAHRAADGSVVFGSSPPPRPLSRWGSRIGASVTSPARRVAGGARPHLRPCSQRTRRRRLSRGEQRPFPRPDRSEPPSRPPCRCAGCPYRSRPAPTWAAAVQRDAEPAEVTSPAPSEPPVRCPPGPHHPPGSTGGRRRTDRASGNRRTGPRRRQPPRLQARRP